MRISPLAIPRRPVNFSGIAAAPGGAAERELTKAPKASGANPMTRAVLLKCPSEILHPSGCPEGLPVRRMALCQRLPREEVGQGKGPFDRAPVEILPEHPGQPVALGLQLLQAAPLGHEVDSARQIPPDLSNRPVRGNGLRAHGVHGADVHLKNGTGEAEHDAEEKSQPLRISPFPRTA